MKLHSLFGERPIAFYPALRRITGSIPAAILLQQLLYWWDKKEGDVLYKTIKEIEDETSLTEKEQRTAIRKLTECGFVVSFLKGAPPKRHFVLNIDAIDEAIKGQIKSSQRADSNPPKGQIQILPKGRFKSSQRADSNPPKGQIQILPKGRFHIQENTTETTTEDYTHDRRASARSATTSSADACEVDVPSENGNELPLHSPTETPSQKQPQKPVEKRKPSQTTDTPKNATKRATGAPRDTQTTFKRSEYGGRIPVDWFTLAYERGLSRDDAKREANRFVAYWTEGEGAAKRKKDWRRTWLTWISRHPSYRRPEERKAAQQQATDDVKRTMWRRRIMQWANAPDTWDASWGPAPDEAGCQAPDDLVELVMKARAGR